MAAAPQMLVSARPSTSLRPGDLSTDQLDRVLSLPWYAAIAAILDVVDGATRECFRVRGLKAALLPITTGSVSSPSAPGSDSSPVVVRFESAQAYLADSQQFLLELALRITGSGTYYIMPSFRGEVVDARHLSQFFHAEAEIFGDLRTAMDLAEALIRSIVTAVVDKCSCEVLALAGTLQHLKAFLTSATIEIVTFEEASRILARPRETKRAPLKEGEERALLEHFNAPVWITSMPAETVPFYQAVDAATDNALAADLLAGFGEILGAGQRWTLSSEIQASMNRQRVDSTPYAWYLKMKQLRPVQTSGFGLGIERLLMWILACPDIRHCCLLLRDDLRQTVLP